MHGQAFHHAMHRMSETGLHGYGVDDKKRRL